MSPGLPTEEHTSLIGYPTIKPPLLNSVSGIGSWMCKFQKMKTLKYTVCTLTNRESSVMFQLILKGRHGVSESRFTCSGHIHRTLATAIRSLPRTFNTLHDSYLDRRFVSSSFSISGSTPLVFAAKLWQAMLVLWHQLIHRVCLDFLDPCVIRWRRAAVPLRHVRVSRRDSLAPLS